MSLPPELWRSIFHHAVDVVPFLFDTEWDYDPDNRIWEGWIGCWSAPLQNQTIQRRTLVQVSREWRELGSEFLYEVVRIPSPVKYDRLGVLIDIFKASAARGERGYG